MLSDNPIENVVLERLRTLPAHALTKEERKLLDAVSRKLLRRELGEKLPKIPEFKFSKQHEEAVNLADREES